MTSEETSHYGMVDLGEEQWRDQEGDRVAMVTGIPSMPQVHPSIDPSNCDTTAAAI